MIASARIWKHSVTANAYFELLTHIAKSVDSIHWNSGCTVTASLLFPRQRRKPVIGDQASAEHDCHPERDRSNADVVRRPRQRRRVPLHEPARDDVMKRDGVQSRQREKNQLDTEEDAGPVAHRLAAENRDAADHHDHEANEYPRR